jgi:hypothetical protein
VRSGRWIDGRFQPDPAAFGDPDLARADGEALQHAPTGTDETPALETGSAPAEGGSVEPRPSWPERGHGAYAPYPDEEADDEIPVEPPRTPDAVVRKMASFLLPVAAVLAVGAGSVLVRAGGAIPIGPIADIEAGLSDAFAAGNLPAPFAPFLPPIISMPAPVEPPTPTQEAAPPPQRAPSEETRAAGQSRTPSGPVRGTTVSGTTVSGTTGTAPTAGSGVLAPGAPAPPVAPVAPVAPVVPVVPAPQAPIPPAPIPPPPAGPVVVEEPVVANPTPVVQPPTGGTGGDATGDDVFVPDNDPSPPPPPPPPPPPTTEPPPPPPPTDTTGGDTTGGGTTDTSGAPPSP